MTVVTKPVDPSAEQLAHKIVAAYSNLPADRRLLVVVAGRPGAGKSTLAYPLTDRVNELLRHPQKTGTAEHNGSAATDGEVAICVGLDGWHYTRAQLDAFPDPKLAHYRRGASWTFDEKAYSAFVSALRAPLLPTPPAPIPFPTFDHSVGDPAPSPAPVEPRHRIVIIEGLYTLLDEPGWRETAQAMDLRVWLEVPREIVLERVLRRHLATGLYSDPVACRKRVEDSDMANGDEVATHRVTPTDILYPVDIPHLAA